MRTIFCKQIDIAGQHSVTLYQTGFNRFRVQYGKQVKEKLTYAQAAKELGECVMHALSCAGRVDNRTKKEAKESGDGEPVVDNSPD